MNELTRDETTSLSERFDRGQLIAWLLLGLPLLVYVLVWPIRARLDRGVIERHSGWSIWKRMTESLPTVGQQILFEIAFVAGLIAFMVGSLLLVWLALEKSPANLESTSDFLADLDQPPSD